MRGDGGGSGRDADQSTSPLAHCARTVHDDGPTWLPIAEAAERLGLSIDGMRARVRRRTAQVRRSNSGRLLVAVAAEQSEHALTTSAEQSEDSADRGAATGRHEELAEARERAAKAEGLAEARAETIASLTATLAHERARADRLEAALVEARRPWLARVLDGLRRKGG